MRPSQWEVIEILIFTSCLSLNTLFASRLPADIKRFQESVGRFVPDFKHLHL